jgi:hypothetical protein
MTPRYVFKNGKFDRIVWEKVETEAEILQFQEEPEVVVELSEDEKQAS